MARLVVLGWLLAGCGLPVKEPTPTGPGSPSGGALPLPSTCECYFEQWSLRTPCGTRCVGDAKLFCSATAASVSPDGCAVAAPDAGVVDAGAPLALDAGTIDASVADCTPASDACSCTFAPYATEGFQLTIPCCSVVCLASRQDQAFACFDVGVTELIGVPAVCRR